MSQLENHLYIQIASYLNLQYPGVIYHFDLSGVNNQSPVSRALYSNLNGRAWPDLFIAEPAYVGSYLCHGIYLELKKEGTKIFKKDGDLVADPHIREQFKILESLKKKGYQAKFACGFDDAKRIIDTYLS